MFQVGRERSLTVAVVNHGLVPIWILTYLLAGGAGETAIHQPPTDRKAVFPGWRVADAAGPGSNHSRFNPHGAG